MSEHMTIGDFLWHATFLHWIGMWIFAGCLSTSVRFWPKEKP